VNGNGTGEKAGLELISYLFCYVLVPAGVAVLYLAHLRASVDLYWTTVLPATYLCYLVIPFAPTIPPRLRHRPSSPVSTIQSVNLFILRRASIQLNTFPSAHVASTVAGSLVLLRMVPAAGAVFLIVSLSIAAGAVLGRYHFTLDVILGALVSLTVFIVILGI
jgi:membrane-associated phospholipid phosphatase